MALNKKLYTTIAVENEIKDALDRLSVIQSWIIVKTPNDKIRFLMHSVGLIDDNGNIKKD